MTCQQIKQALWDYHDGEATESERRDVATHLASCQSCQRELREWRGLSERVFPKTKMRAPAFLWTRIEADIARRETSRGTWWRQWRWMSRVATAMTVFVFLAAGFVYYDASQETTLDQLLQGVTSQEQAAELMSDPAASPEIVTAWVMEGDSSWRAN